MDLAIVGVDHCDAVAEKVVRKVVGTVPVAGDHTAVVD